jgi:hypothetical protein
LRRSLRFGIGSECVTSGALAADAAAPAGCHSQV